MTPENRSMWSRVSGRMGRLLAPMPALLVAAMLGAAGTMINDACSQTPGAAASPPTVSTPPIKPLDQAAKDLQKDPPLNPLSAGDPLPRNLFVEMSKLINPTVVSISTSSRPRQSSRYRDPLQEFLEDFWGGRGGPGMQPPRRQQPMTALGTGFIVREDGLIITNNHVVQQADVIKVQLDNNSDKFYEAEVVGHDALTDIALIKIDAKRPLPFARLGTSKEVQVGEWVAAFGNPYGHAHTMTKGIVSAIGREIAELNRFPFIQTDASINPGNSGGPLVNTNGYVIGVNTAIDARAQGIGFAIPIDNVKQIMQQLEKDGRVRRGWIGVGIASIEEAMASHLGMEEPRGVLITQIWKKSPAEKAGIQPYDIIMDFNGKKTNSPQELQNAVASVMIGDKANVTLWRYNDAGKKKELKVSLTVTENPDDMRKGKKEQKQYFGQKAPFDLGFKIADFNEQLAQEFELDPNGVRGPVVTEVAPSSAAAQAGINAGDVILDVNRQPAAKATDVVKLLKKGRNILRLVRGNLIMIVSIGA